MVINISAFNKIVKNLKHCKQALVMGRKTLQYYFKLVLESAGNGKRLVTLRET